MRKFFVSIVAIVGVAASLLLPATAANASSIGTGGLVCTVTVAYPHPSGHVPGTVNVESTVLCNGVIPRIQLKTALYKSTGTSWWGATKVVYDKKTTSSSAATSCAQTPATFYGAGVLDVAWPVGYTGTTHATAYSPEKSVTCAAAKAASASLLASDREVTTLTISASKD